MPNSMDRRGTISHRDLNLDMAMHSLRGIHTNTGTAVGDSRMFLRVNINMDNHSLRKFIPLLRDSKRMGKGIKHRMDNPLHNPNMDSIKVRLTNLRTHRLPGIKLDTVHRQLNNRTANLLNSTSRMVNLQHRRLMVMVLHRHMARHNPRTDNLPLHLLRMVNLPLRDLLMDNHRLNPRMASPQLNNMFREHQGMDKTIS
jgi:hypothetical protein